MGSSSGNIQPLFSASWQPLLPPRPRAGLSRPSPALRSAWCGSGIDTRGVTDEMLISDTRRATLDEVTDWVLWADKSLSSEAPSRSTNGQC